MLQRLLRARAYTSLEYRLSEHVADTSLAHIQRPFAYVFDQILVSKSPLCVLINGSLVVYCPLLEKKIHGDQVEVGPVLFYKGT